MKILFSVAVLFLFFTVQAFSRQENADQNSVRKHNPGEMNEGTDRVSKRLESKKIQQDLITGNKNSRILKQSSPAEDILTGYIFQIWDGTQWVDSIRNTAERDEETRTVYWVTEVRNGSQWENLYRTSETYDTGGNWIEWISYYWNGEWTEVSKETQTYNENGDELVWISYSRILSGWENYRKEERTYDENDYWTGWSYFIGNGSDWTETIRQEIINNEDGYWIEFTEEVWNGLAWEFSDKESQGYNSYGDWTEWYDYNPYITGGWIPYESEMRTYDAGRNWTEWTESFWGGSNWDPEERETAEYENNNQVEWVEYVWNDSGWDNEWKETMVYDERNNLTELTAWFWDTEWVSVYQKVMTYDENSNNTESVYREWSGTQWTDISRYLYTYSSPTGINENSSSLFTYSLSANFPNPFNPSTSIRYNIAEAGFVTIKVYDAIGKEAASLVNEVKAPGEYTLQFDASGLASGIYFYRLAAGNYTETRRMILLK